MTDWTPAMTKTSKFLSLVLRHNPGAAGVVLDEAGWVDVDELLAGAARNGRRTTRAQLDQIVAENPKQRFAFDASGTRIRAVQGHSVAVELGYRPAVPPQRLYHGTASRTLASIMAEGLRPMSRQQVHLSADIPTARTVGSRHGKPVILEVDSAAMHARGVPFWVATNGVWLCESVPAADLTQLSDG